MAYSVTRLGHIAANQWETWNISGQTGVIFISGIVVGSSSGATAVIMGFGINFSFAIANLTLLRYNGTAFTNGETCNVYTVNGGASVGTFVLAAGGATSTAIHPVVVVTGTDTANLFEYIYGQSNANGWGYESTNNTQATLNCSIMVGDPFQAAVTSAVSKLEAVTHNGSLFAMGNSTYATTFTIGEGTYGDVGTCRNGITVDNDLTIAPVNWWGSCRYGKVNIFASYINTVAGGWACDMTNVTTYEAQNLGSLEIQTFPVSSIGRDASDDFRVYNCVAGAGLLLAHGDMEFNDISIGSNGTYGFVLFGPGDFTATNLTVLNSAAVTDGFGFIAQGTKTFLNCTLDETDVTGFWSSYTSLHQYSVDMSAETPDGTAVENVRSRIWDDDQDILSDTPKFNVLSDASGDFVQQIVTYAEAGSPTPYDNFQPFTFFINKAGFEEELFDFTFTEPTSFTFSMKNVKKDFS